MRNTTHNPHFIPIQILHSSFFTNACVRGERERGLRLYLSPYSPAVPPLSVCAKVVYLSAVARPWNVLAYDRGVNLCEVSTQREKERESEKGPRPVVMIPRYMCIYLYIYISHLMCISFCIFCTLRCIQPVDCYLKISIWFSRPRLLFTTWMDSLFSLSLSRSLKSMPVLTRYYEMFK